MAFDRSKFIGQFREETAEHIQNVTDTLINLEKDPHQRDLIEYALREAHTIKGSATLMGFKRISEIAHTIEGGFELAYNNKITLSKTHFNQIFKCLDAIAGFLNDKVTWEDSGIEFPYAKELCEETESLFSGKAPAKKAPTKPDAPKIEDEPTLTSIATETSIDTIREESIRVKTKKLDTLVNLSGELLINKIMLTDSIKQLRSYVESYNPAELKPLFNKIISIKESVDSSISELQHEVMNLRLVEVSQIFKLFPRAMRDLAEQKGKQIELKIHGEETQLDKMIVDEMKDPIMHLLRNAIDHGIEAPDERKAKGKNKTGNIILSANQRGAHVIIQISDDGRGIDVGRIRARAIERHILPKGKIDSIPDDQICQLLFTPGFTTKNIVTETSGRGVGLNVVREKIAKFKGIIDIETFGDRGTRFTLKLPLTLAVTQSLMVAAGNENFLIPIDTVVETLRVDRADILTTENREIITIRDSLTPIIRLHDLFKLPERVISKQKYLSIIIVQFVEKRVALIVDEIHGRQEVVSKSLGAPLKNVRHIAGATVLGSGKVVLLLDIPSIIEASDGLIPRIASAAGEGTATTRKRYILLAEDSQMIAALEKNILESAGYIVTVASNGIEAMEKAAQAEFDLIITDILMPEIDGFELIESLKKDNRYKNTPVIVVTTRENDADKKRGLKAGANAYVLKSEFTSLGLLETIKKLLD